MNVEPYDRNTYLVQSRTREDVKHIVDLDEMTCSCEAAMEFMTTSEKAPCHHIESALAFRADIGTTETTSNPLAIL